MRRPLVIAALLLAVGAPSYGGVPTFPGNSGGGSSGVSSLNGQTGVVTTATTTGLSQATAAGMTTFSQTVMASWNAANVRWYCIDGTNGSDLNVGFSDTSSADCGTKALKTIAALGAIIPRAGAGRKVVIELAAGTYADALDLAVSNTTGYTTGFPLVVGTVTNSTASSVAFAGDANDRIMVGFVTATGMNAAGYNPVSAFSQTALKCLTVAAGAPGFPSETAAPIPMGWRVRFDSNTTTVALRNATAPIVGISAADTLTLNATATGTGFLPAIPVGTDVFYIEMAGVNVAASKLQTGTTPGVGVSDTGLPAIVGVQFAGSSEVASPFRFIGVGGSFQVKARLDTPNFYFDETGTQRAVGCSLRNTGTLFFLQLLDGPNGNSANNGWVSTGGLSIQDILIFNICNGTYIAGGVTLSNVHGDVTSDPANQQPINQFGARVANAQSAVRIRGVVGNPSGGSAALNLLASDVSLTKVDISGIGAFPAIYAQGINRFLVSGSLTSSAGGNTDVGLDLTKARSSTIVMSGTPTVTGAAGDVRLCDGTIAAWATLATSPLTDACGNQFITATGTGGPSSVANGTTATTQTGVGPAAAATSIQRWMKVPDTTGGYYLVPSYHVTFPGSFDLSPMAPSPLDLN